MASYQLIALALVTIFLPTLTMAAEHVVGDDQGWAVNFNCTTWASGKVFHVGDTLVFNYKPPHNLFKVDGAGFKDCAATGEPMASGKKWYICGYGKHCSELGQKLVINVEAETPEPNAAYGLAASGYEIFAAAVAVVAMIAA
ncbi:mavicyanin-like [Populus alba x Populus x berolinensis]|nr:mavicyanin-like [Populus alba x Populus x berolinensis]